MLIFKYVFVLVFRYQFECGHLFQCAHHHCRASEKCSAWVQWMHSECHCLLYNYINKLFLFPVFLVCECCVCMCLLLSFVFRECEEQRQSNNWSYNTMCTNACARIHTDNAETNVANDSSALAYHTWIIYMHTLALRRQCSIFINKTYEIT